MRRRVKGGKALPLWSFPQVCTVRLWVDPPNHAATGRLAPVATEHACSTRCCHSASSMVVTHCTAQRVPACLHSPAGTKGAPTCSAPSDRASRASEDSGCSRSRNVCGRVLPALPVPDTASGAAHRGHGAAWPQLQTRPLRSRCGWSLADLPAPCCTPRNLPRWAEVLWHCSMVLQCAAWWGRAPRVLQWVFGPAQ